MTERIETTRLNRGLKDILDRIAAGDTFILTRYGKDVARLGPAYPDHPDALPVPAEAIPPVVGTSAIPPIFGSPTRAAQSARDALLRRARSEREEK